MNWYGRVTDSEAVTHAPAFDRRCFMGPDRTAVTEAAAPTMENHGSAPGSGPRRVDRNCVRAAKWAPVADAPERNGMWIGQHVLAAASNDIIQLLPLVDGIPPLRGRPGRSRRKPALVQGDRGYDSQPYRRCPSPARYQDAARETPNAPRQWLGRTRWVVERTLAWLHRFRRLNLRYERRSCIHEAFLTLGCSLICWNFSSRWSTFETHS
jgi:transposase